MGEMMANTNLPISQLSVRTNSSNRVHLDALCCIGLRLVDVRCGFCPHLGDGSFPRVEIGHRGVNEVVKCNKRCAAERKNENPQMPKGALNKRLSRICQSLLIVVYRLLFADAELGENFTQDIVCGNFAGNGFQMVEDFSDILGE